MSTIARWSIDLDVCCPNCEHEFDVMDNGDAGDILHGIQPCQADEAIHLQCPKCEHDFEAKTIY